MASNASLSNAKAAKNDEFYTQYSDIEAEINAYVEFNPDVFRGKIILLPCDDPEWSNFTRYFASNFTRFGLKKLISTSYAKSRGGGSRHSSSLTRRYSMKSYTKHAENFLRSNAIRTGRAPSTLPMFALKSI